IVVSERGVDPDRGETRRLADRLLRPLTDAYIGNSADVAEFIRSSHRIEAADPRVFEVGNGIDTGVFYPAPVKPGSGPIRLITASRLVASKRLDFAVEILRRLTRSREAELLVIGDGPERPHLEHLAQELPVRFVGHVSERLELADMLRGADVFLMTSETEGLPNAILEALSCGIPVVASDAPGVRNAAGVGVTLIDGDEDVWCRAILDAARRGRSSEPLGNNRVSSFDQVARRHLEVFHWALQRRQGEAIRRRKLGNSTFTEVL
ncbi:MAG TPA: glycosyltransferase family 4 protein, partial [Acidimicrobiia bacterium]